MIFAPHELDQIRSTFDDLAPTEPADIAVWLAKTALDTQHDHLVVDAGEWRTDPGLNIPAWHVGELGVLASDLDGFTRSLTEDGHDEQSRLMLSARSAAITALAKMAQVHEELAATGPGVRRPNVLGVQHAADQARRTLGRAAAELGTYLATVPHGAPGRASAARSATGRANPGTPGPAPAVALPPRPSTAPRR